MKLKIGQHFPLQQSNQKSSSISPSTTRGLYRVTRVDVCDLRARPVLSLAGAKTCVSGRNTNGQTRKLPVPSHVKVRRPGIAVNSRLLKSIGRATFDTSLAHGPKGREQPTTKLIQTTNRADPYSAEPHAAPPKRNKQLGSISPLNSQTENWAAFPP